MSYPTFRLDNQVVVITGASKGIGRGLAKVMTHAGATTILCSRSETELNELETEIKAEGGVAYTFPLDVTSVTNIKATFKSSFEKFNRIDVLINNAGLGFNHPAAEVTEEDWDEMMTVNMKGLFFCAQQAGLYMAKNNYGRIINMSSQASLVAIKDHAVYCASKGGVNMITKVLALEWAELGITVNNIAPTFTYTPGTSERLDNPEYLEKVLDRIPVKKVTDINDIASAILYLTGSSSGMTTGITLVIDGGWTVQ